MQPTKVILLKCLVLGPGGILLYRAPQVPYTKPILSRPDVVELPNP